MVLTAAVLITGLVGLFLLYLAEQRIEEVAQAQALPPTEEQPTPVEEQPPAQEQQSAEKEQPPAKESAARRPWGKYLLIGGMFLCGGAMAVCLDRVYAADTLHIVNLLLLCSVLWPCAWADAQVKVIPNRVLLAGLTLRAGVLGLELAFFPQDVLIDLVRGAIAAAALCLVCVLCRLVVPKSIGLGDIKLLMLMGFYLGTDRIGGSIFCTMAVSFVYSLFLILTRRANMKTELSYAPLLLIGTVLATFLIDV